MPRRPAAVPEEPEPVDAGRLTKKTRQLKAPWPFLYSVTKKDGIVRNLLPPENQPATALGKFHVNKAFASAMDWDDVGRGSL